MKCNDRYVNLEDERWLGNIAWFKLREAAAKKGTSGRLSQKSIKYRQSIKYGFSSQSSYKLDTMIGHKSEDLRQE
ncbi:hypothetical protein [Pontibacter litorisediminis]|uniref:hypothetical protein n=1 Tax=Pontibacter litorisediminis TaxID=1846260 RepID=UPI0023ECF1FD|nr:hypothetical protein [Pontibacter litorisediminis]